MILISQLSSADQVVAYTDLMDDFCRQAKRVCGVRVTAGVGQLCASLEELRLSYQGARNAVSYRALYGSSRAINIAEIEPKEQSEETWEEEALRRIMKQIRLGRQRTAGGRNPGLYETFYRKRQFSAEIPAFCYGADRRDHPFRQQKPAKDGNTLSERK